MSPDRRAPLAYAACALIVLLGQARAARPGMAFVGRDLQSFFVPLRQGLWRTVSAGEMPFWQRGMFLGYPLLGDPQPALFDPFTWLFGPGDAARSLTLGTLAHLVVAAVGMAFWMRQRRLGAIEGVFAGVAFALGAKQTAHLIHWNFAASTCAWPWMMAGLDAFERTRRGRFVALTAVATCASWLGGSPPMAYLGSLLAGGYALSLAPALGRRSRLDAVLAVAAAPMGLLLAAPLVLPVLELAALGPRGAGATYGFAASWGWPDRSAWAALILPRAWGGMPAYRGPLNSWEMAGYLGLLPMALAALAPMRARRCWFLLAMAILGIWIAFGDSAWLRLHRIATELLPGYRSFRVPTRALMLSSIATSALAAEGLARLRGEPRLRLTVLAALGVLTLAVLALVSHPQGYDAVSLRVDAEAAAVLIGAAAIWALAARPTPVWAALAIPLLLGDLAFQLRDANEVGPAAEEGHALEALAPYVPPGPAPRRIAVLSRHADTNATYARGWEGVTGWNPTLIQRVSSLFEATFTGRVAPLRPATDDTLFPRFDPRSDLCALFAAPLLAVRARGAPPADGRTPGGVDVFPLPALPRVYWTGAFLVADDAQVSAPLHQAARGDIAVLAQPLDRPSGEPAGPVAALDTEVSTNRLAATVRAPRDGLVVVLDPFFPGWRARVDGTPAPLVRANYAFEAVPVRAGTHRVELRYFPTRLVPGLLVAVLCALALATLLRLRRNAGPR